MSNPIKVREGRVFVKLNYSYSLRSLSTYPITRYVYRQDIFWRNDQGRTHKKVKGSIKSKDSSKLIDLRFQFRPACCRVDNFDSERNDVIGMRGDSTKDFIYTWHFVHRHGFPSKIYGSGRGQNMKVDDILNHPLSYMLMCNEHHEQYDRENGEWKNPLNHKKKE